MAKGTKRKVPVAALGPKQQKENPFEALHAKHKFNVIGRKVSETKNVNKARSQAVDKRRKTLLVEYKQLKNANAFIDRRFGEHNDELTEDEKAIARFQAQRLKQARKSKFALADEAEGGSSAEGLTHLGNPLSELDDFKQQVDVDDDDDEGGLGDDMVRQFHFGGGEGSDGGPKSKKEVMEEIIAKSKTFKAAKRLQKDEDEQLVDDLDARYNQLRQDNVIGKYRKPVGANRDDRQRADNEEDGAYDKLRREVAFEGRGRAGERSLAAEELVAKEQERLAKLEKARLKRMRGEEDADDEDADAPAGGYAKRRLLAKKQAAADEAKSGAAGDGAEDEDDFEAGSGSDDDGGDTNVSALDARRAARAAGNHPLDVDFRATTASLLLKYGMKPSEQSMRDLEEKLAKEGDDDDDDDDDEDDEEGGDDDEDGDSDGEDDDNDESPHSQNEDASDGDHPIVARGGVLSASKRGRVSGASAAALELHVAADGDGPGGEHESLEGRSSQEPAASRRERAELMQRLQAGSDDSDGAEEDADGDSDDSADGEEEEDSEEEEGEDGDGENDEMAMWAKLIELKKQLDAAPDAATREALRRKVLHGSSDDDDDNDDDDDDDEEAAGADAGDESDRDGGADVDEAAADENAAEPRGRAAAKRADARPAVADDERRASGGAAASTRRAALADADGPLDLPFTIAAPTTYAEFERLVAGRPAADLAVVVQRIRVYNAAALAADSKQGLQVLYGILVQHFAAAAGARPLAADVLDALVPTLVAMTAEVPLYAATLARARLAAIFNRMSQSLQDPESQVNSWPPPRACLLMQLFSLTFPTSDRRHPVITPLALTVGHALSFCPPNGPHDVAVGLFLASLLLRMAAPAKRHAPEVVPWLEALLASSLPRSLRTNRPLLSGHLRVEEGWLHNPKGHGAAKKPSAATAGLPLWGVLGRDPGDAYFRGREFRTQALCTCLGLARQVMANLDDCDALPEVLLPLVAVLKDVVASSGLANDVLQLAKGLLADMEAASQACQDRRRPLVNPAMKGVKLQKLFNPRYEVDFDKTRDYDPDRERAEQRKERRALTKEYRGVKREIGRDAVFMGEVRRKEKDKAGVARDKTQKKAIAFLQQQEADFKSGGQGGMNPHKKNRKQK